jgi:hypothetical protein
VILRLTVALQAWVDAAHSHSAVHHCIAPTQIANPCSTASDKLSLAVR